MNRFKLAGLVTLMVVVAVILFLTVNHKEVSSEISNESIIIIDNENLISYTEYTDELELAHSLGQSNKLTDESKRLIEQKQEKERIIAQQKRIAEALRVKEEKRKAELKRIAAEKAKKAELARIAEEKRQIELARVVAVKEAEKAEAKRMADLEAKRVAKNKAKEEAKKNNSKTVVASRGNTSNVSEAYYEITAYTAGVESTGKRKGDKGYGITASGAQVKQGITIACPKNFAFGTKVEIEGYGMRVCQDTGSAIGSGKIDLYMDSLSAAQSFGRQTLRVKIYK